jgi:hypothetical protein
MVTPAPAPVAQPVAVNRGDALLHLSGFSDNQAVTDSGWPEQERESANNDEE